MAEPTTLSIICLGAVDDALRALVRDVLGDQGLRIYFAPRWHHAPDLVLAGVRQWDVTAVMSSARQVAGAVPILAILPINDERLVQLACAAGAWACFALDTPLARLKECVGGLVAARAPRGGGG